MTIATPIGISVFVRRVDSLDDHECAAACAKLRAAGVRNVFVMVEPVDARIASIAAVRRFVAHAHQQLISVYLWSFPDHTRRTPEAVVGTLERYAKGLPIIAPILDIERANGNFPSAAWCEEVLERGHELAVELGKGGSVGMTSYGITSWHPRIPWRAMSKVLRGRGYSLPQTYTTALQPTNAALAMQEHAALFDALVPCIPAWDVNRADKLGEVAQMRAVTERMGKGVNGLGVWSDPQLDPGERGVLRAYATTRGWV